MNTPLDLSHVDQAIASNGPQRHHILNILHAVQSHYGYLPEPALERICERTEMTPASLTGIITFYDKFRHKPCGEHMISVCIGTACHVKGAGDIVDAFKRYLGIKDDADTDADGMFTVQKVACLGCCTLAPAVQIDDLTYGHLTPDTVGDVIDDFLANLSRKRKRNTATKKGKQSQGELRISLDSCCIARGTGKVHAALQMALDETGIYADIKHVGCVGICSHTPILEVTCNRESFLYTNVTPEEAKPIILRHFKPPTFLKRIITTADATLDKLMTNRIGIQVARYPSDVRDPVIREFRNRQLNIATELYGILAPDDIDEYIGHGGFEALEKALNHMSADMIINELQESGLRGRGGAGYPTALKWSEVQDAVGEQKYVVCNGDEGDPGAFMDRMIMESYPYRILEGLIIAARTVGASEAILYIRSEYPVATHQMRQAIANCIQRNFLGKNIMGTEFSLTARIVPGAGAFVCGEETALLASIEGRRGIPRLRPPYPSQSGLWGKPTLVNNVETLASIPWIIRHGAERFAAFGTDESKGTKVFALAGKVARGSLIEVPMGMTIREIVDDIGGGSESGIPLKAVQIGGPSGGCIPMTMADIPIDYESLKEAGSMMGSGGLVVLDESDCMVDIARYFLEFTQSQSCGKCTFCRIGTRRMLDILERLCNGAGRKGDIEQLELLASHIQNTSLCGLGRTAPNPVLSTLNYFRAEYQAHIDGHCPAGRCKSLIQYTITDDCIGCTRCAQHCPADAIPMTPYQKHQIHQDLCIRCGGCRSVCPENAVKVR